MVHGNTDPQEVVGWKGPCPQELPQGRGQDFMELHSRENPSVRHLLNTWPQGTQEFPTSPLLSAAVKGSFELPGIQGSSTQGQP